MKKLFTMIAVCAVTLATYTASAGTIVRGTETVFSKSASSISYLRNSSLRSAALCDTLSNLGLADSISTYYGDTVGYLTGNGALWGGTAFLPNLGVGEKFDGPGLGVEYVSGATVFFAFTTINVADSNNTVTAYVYDTTGTGNPYNPGYAPGHAIDSATVTLGAIAAAVTNTYTVGLTPTIFTFNNVHLPSNGFFITIRFPQVIGDTIVVFTNDGSSGNGEGWLDVNFGGASQWLLIDSLGQGPLGNWIFPAVCGSTCPTITVTATELGSTTSASATATGGVNPYTYSWSSSAATDTATGLTNGQTYTVTATDHNGCSGTATVSISTGIESIAAGVTNFSVFPNPSNGIFTANVSLVAASDVTISVTDMTGSKIFESTDKAVKEINKQINLSSIATGIYFVSVKTAQGTANQRIVIK